MTAGTSDDVALGAGTVYLYGLVLPAGTVPSGLTGIAGRIVRAEALAHVDALVSDAPDGREIGLPDDVRDHTRVLDAVAAEGPVLPVRFGTTAERGALEQAVPPGWQQQHADALRGLSGAVQLTLTARYVEEALLAELVAADPEIRRLREATRGRPEAATYGARVRLGELVVAGFDRRRPADAERVERVVAPFARRTLVREVTQTDAVAELALLLARDDVPRLEEALEDLAARVAGHMVLRLVGPQAPYDFVGEV